ncbi:MAG: NCS2 family permease [Candidatus Latescibacteria bacterium]|nr:NCS2 family permease [bacterium]MBD3424670.1 NCS2 family permease [Candidatus Latescibacterota bacterium]
MNSGNSYPWMVKKDIDGFFGLAIDNLIQFLLIISLCPVIAGIPPSFVLTRILPGAALSLIVGNLFYSWQARKLARRERRDDVTALPYGINTVSLFAYLIFIMGPVYRETGSYQTAWKAGLLACFLSGVIEFGSAFFMDTLRRITPRAALLSTLAGIAITFISMDFALQTFDQPLIAMLPLAIILIQYFSGVRFPLGLPGGMVALAAGTVLAWLFGLMDPGGVKEAFSEAGFIAPRFSGGSLFEIIRSGYFFRYLSIIIPMALFNVFGSIQNLESAEAAGDRYETKPSLAVNGIGSLLASFFGSCFPTTIYIGHPGWKGLGARTGYSLLNGIFFVLITMTGAVRLINSVVPMEAGIAIVFWIGIMIAAQAFQATPKEHAPAVVVGLFPAFAAWGVNILKQAYQGVGTDLASQAAAGIPINGIMGMFALEKGFIFSSMILAAVSVFLIEKDFIKAVIWSCAGMLLAFFGVMHTFSFTGNDTVSVIGWNAGGEFAFGYLCFALIFLGFYLYRRLRRG